MWHSASSSVRHGGGYPSTAAGCSLYRPSRQYDDENGALDAAADIALARAVDEVIETMEALHRAALSMEARNLCTVRVCHAARLGDDAAQVVRQARALLWLGMDKKGLAS